MTSSWLVPEKKTRDPKSSARAWETRRERDERVEQNLDPWELEAFRRHKALFKGTPEERTRAFREWTEEHPAELRGHAARSGESKAARLVREKREREKGVKVPCAAPWRKRVRAACNPEAKRKPKWTLTIGGHRVEVPCDAPWRFGIKRDCRPKKKWAPSVRKAPPKPAEPEGGFFDDLLYG